MQFRTTVLFFIALGAVFALSHASNPSEPRRLDAAVTGSPSVTPSVTPSLPANLGNKAEDDTPASTLGQCVIRLPWRSINRVFVWDSCS
jgi:hypothetical protein